jgi:hypothetical protein
MRLPTSANVGRPVISNTRQYARLVTLAFFEAIMHCVEVLGRKGALLEHG